MLAYLVEEPPQAWVISGDGEVVQVPFEHPRHPRPGFFDGIVHTSTQFHLDGPKCCPHSLLDRLAPDDETSGFSRLGAESARSLRKSNVSGFPSPSFSRSLIAWRPKRISRVFCGCKANSNFAHPFLQILQKLLRLSLMLKADQNIIRIADDDHVACFLLAPGMGPQVENVVEVNVRQNR